MTKTLVFFATFFFSFPVAQTRQQTVQFNINKILNARPVTVLNHNHMETWNKGIDGDGLADGYLTQSAALFKGDKEPHALPDNALFAGNEFHPEIRLHYSNHDRKNDQACAIGADEVEFAVPKAKYSTVYLAFTSAEGASNIRVKLEYEKDETNKNFIVPDYYQDLTPANPNLSYLAHNLAKWGNKNNMTEKDHHNIDLLKIETNPAWKLKTIHIGKTKPGYLVFWAAAGLKN
jgi:hypothetical protein